jgi:hypothetical protein
MLQMRDQQAEFVPRWQKMDDDEDDDNETDLPDYCNVPPPVRPFPSYTDSSMREMSGQGYHERQPTPASSSQSANDVAIETVQARDRNFLLATSQGSASRSCDCLG